MKFNTIHLFGYGEGQIIGTDDNEKGFNKKKPIADLTTVDAFIDDVFAHKPEENTAKKESYHLVNIFANGHVRFMPKEQEVEGFQVAIADLNKEKLEALVAELSA
jgi:hypothetical protein